MIELIEYLDERGHSPFAEWLGGLDDPVQVRITKSVLRLADGNFSATKGVGEGAFELRIDSGPGYRIYFGKDGDRIVILLAGGTKRRQASDIEAATRRWQDYKRRKRDIHASLPKVHGNHQGKPAKKPGLSS